MARHPLPLWAVGAGTTPRRSALSVSRVLPLILAVVGTFIDPAAAQDNETFLQQGPRIGHVALENPADLSREDAEATYQAIQAEMAQGYGLSGVPGSRRYTAWQRFNNAPYRSAQHGERFVNNYGNAAAASYGRYEDAGTMPVGAILAKDSFTVTAEGHVYAGALFLMEKMPAGFRPETKDWRYSMILPDGSLYGTTDGAGDDQVTFCADCHRAAGDDRDHLFLIPEDYRK